MIDGAYPRHKQQPLQVQVLGRELPLVHSPSPVTEIDSVMVGRKTCTGGPGESPRISHHHPV